MLEATISPVIRAHESLNLITCLTTENLAFRQQLMVLKRCQMRLQLSPTTLLCMVAFFDFGEEDTHSVEFSQPSFPV